MVEDALNIGRKQLLAIKWVIMIYTMALNMLSNDNNRKDIKNKTK